MGASLPFPQQPRAGFEAGSGSQIQFAAPARLLGDVAQPAVQFGSEATQRLFLQAVGDRSDQQLPAEPAPEPDGESDGESLSLLIEVVGASSAVPQWT